MLASVAHAEGLSGRWSGTVQQSGADPYSVTMELSGSQGSVDYPQLGCGGTLTMISSGGSSFSYRESITYGQKKCIDGGIIRVTADSSGTTLDWNWSGSGITASATLNGRRTSKDCSEIDQQLARDQNAMHRQQKSIEQGQAELAEWTKKNDDAQKAALKRATNFLVDSLAGKLGDFTEGKLSKLETDFKKRAPLGETWQRKLQKVQEFRAAKSRLTGAVDGIKLAGFTGAATDGWREGKEWAAKNGKDAETLDAILAEWQRDPELQQILKESGISTVSAGLGLSKALAPWGTALDFGQFLVGYGYDATAWTLSKSRIEQQIANRDQDLKAVEALKKQIERTVAKLKACNGE
jgi:hypothetical protein